MGARLHTEHHLLHEQVPLLGHRQGDVERRWLPGELSHITSASIGKHPVAPDAFERVMCWCWLKVGEKSTPERTQCLCNHLTLFGSSFFVMPNYVDLSRTDELFATVSENYVVLALLCAFFGLYLITLMWACYADRRSRSKVSLILKSIQVIQLTQTHQKHRCSSLTVAPWCPA